MISLPILGCDRRALFVSTQRVAVYHWRNGDLGHSWLFEANEEGRRNFRRYLAETADIPFYVLVDVFEEEYRHDTVPHVSARDRRALLQRKLARLFDDTPYCFYRVTGRETAGRRDDRALLAAITNPVVIQPWTSLLDEAKAPLAGIYSLPLFTGALLKLLGEHGAAHRLIVSLQSISGLRQTFFHNGKFHLSRLVKLPRYDSAPRAPQIRAEVEKIRRYLNSLRLIPPEQPLHIHFLSAGELLRELQDEYAQQGDATCHFVDLNELLAKSGSSRRTSAPFSDPLFIRRLLKSGSANCYAGAKERRYFTLRRLRSSLQIAGVLLLLGSAGWSGFNVLGAVLHQQRGAAAREKAQLYAERHELARRRFPETPVAPADLKTAVDIAARLAQYKSSPIDTVQLLSGSLNRFPVIRLNGLAWVVATDPEVDFSAGPSRARAQSVPDSSGRGAGRAVYHIALLEGRIEPFDGNFREAVETVNRFAEDLRSRQAVHSVSVVAPPLDVSPGAALQGNTQSAPGQARFTLRVVSEHRHET